ncbi:MAG: 2-dehydropantoate 2-reductase N-terminal domain-containing protein [Pseudomonadota bacterium]
MFDTPRIVVAGAGSIGCYVGGHLIAAGRNVTFLGRSRIAGDIAVHGLTLTDFIGDKTRLDHPDSNQIRPV